MRLSSNERTERRRRRTVAAVALLVAGGIAATALEAQERASDAGTQVASTTSRVLGAGVSGYGQYLSGRMAERLREPSRAAEFMAGALARDPDNAGLMKRTFSLMLSTGRMEEAARLAERIEKIEPEAPFENVILAMRSVLAGDPAAAERRLKGLSRTGINRILAPLLQAWVEAEMGRFDDALETLDGLGNAKGFALLRDLHSALINDVAGRREAALDSFRAAAEDSASPSFRVVEGYANLLARSGRVDEAVGLFERYAERNPDSVRLQLVLERLRSGPDQAPLVRNARDGLAEAFYDLASALFQESSQRRAMMFANLALYMRPDFDIARMLLGDIQEAREQYLDAIATYGALPPDSPFAWSARLRMASALQRLDRTEEAIALLEKLAEERPERSEPLVALGDLYRSKREFAKAVTAYDRAFERIDKIEKRHWGILYARGIALERSDQWERAEKDFLKALELEPDQPYVLNYLGYSWVEKGMNLDEARRMIERAVELRPNDGYIADSLGWVLYGKGEYEDAVVHLERAVELRPDDPVINDHLGDALWRVGRTEEARFQWRRALRLSPDPKDIPTIESKLRHGLDTIKRSESDS